MTSAHALAGSTEELLKHIHRLCFDKSKDWSNSKASVKANDTVLLRTQAHSGPNKGQQPGQSFLISKVGPCRICGVLLTVASLEEHLMLNHTYCCKDCNAAYIAKPGTAHPGCNGIVRESDLVCCGTFHRTQSQLNEHLATHTAADFHCLPCDRWFGSVDACRQHTRDFHKRLPPKVTPTKAIARGPPAATTPAAKTKPSQASAVSSCTASASPTDRKVVNGESQTCSLGAAPSAARPPFPIPDLTRYPVLTPSRPTDWRDVSISTVELPSPPPKRRRTPDPFAFLLDSFNFPTSSDLIDIKSIAAWT